jgi:hypothetical protein
MTIVFAMDSTLANEDANATEIAFICLGFKGPTRSNVVETRWRHPANMASWLRTFLVTRTLTSLNRATKRPALQIPALKIQDIP